MNQTCHSIIHFISPGQISPLYILAPAFTAHVFFLPYKKWWQNLIEAGVLLNFIFLLLLRSTQTFLDNLASYSGTSVPEERGTELTATNSLTWLFFPFYYLPVFCGIAFCVARVAYFVYR